MVKIFSGMLANRSLSVIIIETSSLTRNLDIFMKKV